jgi:hypothetical protein
MILTVRRQQRVLASMHDSLRGSDPRLVARFATFTELTAGKEIPRIERVRPWPLGWLRSGVRRIARHFARLSQRPGQARPWLQGAVFIPLVALAMIVIALVLVSTGAGGHCAPLRTGGPRTAATAEPLPGAAAARPATPPPLAAAPWAACLFPCSRARLPSLKESVAGELI